MHSRNFSPSHPSARAIRIYGPLAALIVIFAHLTAWSQQAALSAIKNMPIDRRNTPKQVLDGTAKLVGHYEPGNKIRLVLGITPPKLAEEEKFLQELQDKKSPNFHKYLTADQWNARFAPSAEDEQAVVDWATGSGLTVTQRYPHRLVVDVEGTTEVIEKAFSVTINSYQVEGNVEYSNDREPVIPQHLAGILHSVGGLNSIQRVHSPHEGNIREKSPLYSPGPTVSRIDSLPHNGDKKAYELAMKASEDAKAAGSTTLKAKAKSGGIESGLTNGFLNPTDIYSSYAYDFNALQALGHCCNPYGVSSGAPPTTSIAIATAGDYADSDLNGWYNTYPYLAGYPHRVYKDGTPACCNDETTLDLEWAMATSNSFGSGYVTSQTWVYEGANSYSSTFTDVYSQMLADGNARVFSTSWGCAELSCTSSGTMDTDHNIFNSMLGQGWTILALSHDYGTTGGCDDAYRVDYPASDPDSIAVGGTSLALYTDGTFYSETGWTGGTAAGSCSHNNGGSGGGCSAYWSTPAYQYNQYCGASNRSVPDIALNAGYGQNFYFNGALSGVGGTSISTPQAAGFMAQANAYLLALGLGYAPVGEVNYALYYQGTYPSSSGASVHYPYYDITSGCSSNDITAEYNITPFCAGSGYDAVTGWGSFNALQLAWSINNYYLGDFAPPTVHFSGPISSNGSINWFNTDQTVSWTVTDSGSGLTPTGVSGFSQAWDSYFTDPYSEPNQGTGNSFYSGPQFPNATSGYLQLSWAGQGCHYATVDAWDNSGYTSGNQYYYYLCYDTIAPTVTAANSPAANSNGYNNSTVKVSLSASDSGSGASGIKTTYYGLNALCNPSNLGACSVYSGPISVTGTGYNYVAYFTQDVAGNNSGTYYDYAYIDEVAPVAGIALSGTLSGSVYDTAVKVTLSATDNYSGVASIHYSLDGGAVTTYSAPFTVSALGSHTVKYYAVDYAGNTEATKSATFSIYSPTNATLTASPDHTLTGQPVTLTATIAATLSGTPTGTVTFLNGGSSIGTGTLSGGVATLTTSSLPLGANSLTASYAGGSTFLGSSSAAFIEDVRETTTTTVTSSLNPAIYGQSVTFTAKVAIIPGHTPTGTVQFLDGTTVLATETLSGAQATYTTSGLSGGSHSITAAYGGSSVYHNNVSAVLTQTVNKDTATTTLTASPNPALAGATVTLKATVAAAHSGTPTGTVTFKNGTTTLGTGTLSGGVATITTTTLPIGTDSLTASYAGTANVSASTSSAVSEVILEKTTTALVSSLNPSSYDKPVTFTATVTPSVSGTPTGAVNFYDGTTLLAGVSLSGGKASYTTQHLTGGSHSITAVYSGSTTYGTSTSAAVNQTVTAAATSTAVVSSANPSTYGQTITFTATVKTAGAGTPTGTVTFKSGTSTVLGTATLTNGTASISTSGFSPATRSITAVYAGDADYETSTSPAISQVTTAAPTKTTLTSSANPSTHGSSLTFTAKVTASTGPVPTGTVVFKDGTTTLGTGTVNGSGTATYSTSSLAVGTHSITAVYGGSTDDQTSTSSALSQVIH